MALNDKTLRVWQEEYAKGLFNKTDHVTVCSAGWYDWFCSYDSLLKRLHKVAKIVSKIEGSDKIDLDTMYVWFKNNCPMVGPLYDSIRIASIETGDTLYVVDIDSPHTKQEHGKKYAIYDIKFGYKEPVYMCDDLRLVIKWFNE